MASRPRLIYLLSSAHRCLQQWMATQQAMAARPGESAPTAAQSGVLFVLDRADGTSMGELALALDLAPSAVSGLVQRMEALGWVRRQSCPHDARTQRVWLQAQGRAWFPVLHQTLADINARLASGFTETELQTVARWLRHVQQLATPQPDRTP